MAKLFLTAPQAAQIALQDANLQEAFLEGTEAPGQPDLLPLMEKFDSLPADVQKTVRDTFTAPLAAFMQAMGLPGLTTTINYRKSDGTTNGVLTFTNGILTAST